MDKVFSIARKNRETYYNNRTSKLTPVWPRYLAIALSAILLSYAFSNLSDNFLIAVISAQSILAGFSFSVMFFLMSGPKIAIRDGGSLENKSRVARANKIAPEIFYNVSYFNAVAILSVFVAILMLLSVPAGTFKWVLERLKWESNVDLSMRVWIGYILRFFLFSLLLDACLTFSRATRRIVYFFSERLDLTPEN